MGQDASFLQEEHNFHIDQQTQALAHEFFREIGKRLVVNGTIAATDDVFMLTVDEIRSLVVAPAPQGETVSTRRAKLQAAWDIVPPPFIGVPPAGPPSSDTPADRGNIRFWGMNTPLSDDPGVVMGNPGARGTSTGRARVVRTLEEAAALEPGEILVTVTTMPPWSPLFGVAGGVVTETGGPLSHCAIVAREYEIPAVVGATAATSRITTGQLIRIDGSTGIVELDVDA
jgi:pyruvate,water dikinase